MSGKDAYTYWPLTGTQPVSGGNPDSALITTAHGNVIKVEVTNFNPSVASYITNYKLTVQQANVGGADSFVLYYASGFDALNSPPPGPYPANTAYTINIANITPPATPPTISAAFSPTSISTAGGTSTLTLTITNTNASTALSGVAVAAASLPANLTGSSPATTCGGTASFAGGSLSLSGGALAAGTTTSCTVTLTVSSTVAGNYSYTTGVVSASSPAVTGTTATTPTPLTVVAPVTATQAIASKTLTQSAAATSFTPVTGSGGTAPLSYSVSPPLPSGLSMSSATGAITGTPTVASVATTYTVTVTDATSATATNTFSLTVNSAVTATQSVASKTLTQNAAATPFTPVTGGGGTTPYTYGISPSLPAGLSFNTTTGQVTGTPTATSGTTTYTVTVTDANNGTATNTFALTVNSAVTATQAVASKTLTQNVAATSFTPVTGGGGTTPLAYTISPPLPSGLTISSSTGAITGTPTVTTGATTYTVTVTDANNGTASNTFTLTVNGALTATQAIASTTLTVNHAASPFTPVTGSGGTSPLVYSILPTLPTGLSFNTSTGAITGTPTAASVATTYTVTVTDANSGTASNTFQLTINGAVTATQSVATKTLTQNAAATSFTPVTGSGGTSPLHYSVSPPLPNGLSIDNNSGAVTGTPTASSVATTYTVTVTDANSATASNTFILTINAAVTATQAVSSASLTQNHAITPFTPVTGGGGTGTLSYSISPTLPAGLTLSSSTGSVSGTPTASNATATYTVTVTDTNGGTASNTFQLTVNGPLTATQVIASKSLTVSFPISSFAPVTGAGGTGTLTYSVSPTLPPGVAMSPSNGSISGLPTITSAVTTYTVTVTDSNSATATATFQLTVNGPVTATQTVPSKSLTAGTAATSFTPVTGGGGTTPLVYSVSPTLPNGLTLSTATGAVTGTPSAASPTTTYTVTVTDANSATATNTFSLTVNGGVTATQAIATKSLITNSAATPFTPVTGGGGTAPLTYTISPALPAGLTLTSSTGAIGGTPTSASPLTTYTVTVTDANGATATATFQLAVYDAASVTGIVPNSGPTGGGTSVTITGTGFLGASAVKFGATNATSFTVNSTTQITAVSPAGAAGAVSLTVTAPGGTASTTYTYVNLLGLVSTPSPTTQVGQPYSQTNVASGGTSPFTYAVTAGALPPGTSLNASTGLVSGTPSSGGNFSYTIKVTDSSPTQQTATQTVTGAMTTAASTTTVTSSVNPSTVGQSVTFSATVTASGAGVPTGTVTFKDGNTAIGSGALSGGTATFTTAALTLGAHSITASYTGSGNYGASTSQALQQTVNIPADSLKLRALQVNVTRVIAQNSGQAISGAIDSAISEGFSDGGGSFITPSGMGMRFNFAADLDQTQATSGDKIVTDRWNGMVGRDGGKADAQGALGYSGRKHTDDAFAAIDRAAPATKAPPLKAREPQDWILWADVRGSGIDRWGSTMNSGQAPLSGSQVNALMGLTHRVAPNFLLGVVGGYETFDYTSQEFNGKLKGDGWTVGGYLGWKLTPSIRFDAATAYSGINYNGTSGTAQGNFNGNRWLVSGGLTGAYKAWGFDIEPSVRVYALWEHENAYTDSLGTVQDSLNFATGRASGGLKVAYPFAWTETVMLAPYAGVYADYYFTKDDAAAIVAAGALPLASTPLLDGWSARVEGGLAAKFANGAAILAGGELGGIGGNVQIWTLRARARVPF
ncbi:MAG: putative Ig domain-containing protein [Pseudomonadota bacterium]